jgi:competence protein ComEA
MQRLKAFFSFLIRSSVPRILYWTKYLISQTVLRIPHYSIGQQKILFFIAFFILFLLFFKFYFHPSPPPEEFYKEIVVEVSGEVRSPGVYLFKSPPTLKEAVDKAGGLKEAALFDQVSSSERLETGTLLKVTKEFSKEVKIRVARMEASKLLVFSIPLDLNRVSFEDLCLIPGIGESLALEIVTYRGRRKGFQSIDELKKVKGIGEKKWKELKSLFILK